MSQSRCSESETKFLTIKTGLQYYLRGFHQRFTLAVVVTQIVLVTMSERNLIKFWKMTKKTL